MNQIANLQVQYANEECKDRGRDRNNLAQHALTALGQPQGFT
jgi:hypothetical protein